VVKRKEDYPNFQRMRENSGLVQSKTRPNNRVLLSLKMSKLVHLILRLFL
jgi:hypothetical protein